MSVRKDNDPNEVDPTEDTGLAILEDNKVGIWVETFVDSVTGDEEIQYTLWGPLERIKTVTEVLYLAFPYEIYNTIINITNHDNGYANAEVTRDRLDHKQKKERNVE